MPTGELENRIQMYQAWIVIFLPSDLSSTTPEFILFVWFLEYCQIAIDFVDIECHSVLFPYSRLHAATPVMAHLLPCLYLHFRAWPGAPNFASISVLFSSAH